MILPEDYFGEGGVGVGSFFTHQDSCKKKCFVNYKLASYKKQETNGTRMVGRQGGLGVEWKTTKFPMSQLRTKC